MAITVLLGTAQLRARYGMVGSDVEQDEDAAFDLLRVAEAGGVSAIDTAPVYGEAEETIGRFGTELPVHSKLDPRLPVVDSVRGSMARLRRDMIDVLYLHDPAEVVRRNSKVVGETFELVGEIVGAFGASVYELEEFDAAVADPRISVVQMPLNVFDRRIDDSRLIAALNSGTAVYARSVLLQGVLLADARQLPSDLAPLGLAVMGLQRLARDLERTPLDLAIGWVSHRPGVTGIVVGARSAAELDALLGAIRAEPLDAAALQALDEFDLPDQSICDPRTWQS